MKQEAKVQLIKSLQSEAENIGQTWNEGDSVYVVISVDEGGGTWCVGLSCWDNSDIISVSMPLEEAAFYKGTKETFGLLNYHMEPCGDYGFYALVVS